MVIVPYDSVLSFSDSKDYTVTGTVNSCDEGSTVSYGVSGVSYEYINYSAPEDGLSDSERLLYSYSALYPLSFFGGVIGYGFSRFIGLFVVLKYYFVIFVKRVYSQVLCPLGALCGGLFYSFVDHKRGRHINVGFRIK